MRILIVEDDAISRRLYAAVVHEEVPDAVVVDVGKVAQARDHLAAGAVSLVITDLGLPDGDGRDILAVVRASACPQTPVVAVSGVMASEVPALRDLGFDDVLVKPINLAALRAMCRRLLA